MNKEKLISYLYNDLTQAEHDERKPDSAETVEIKGLRAVRAFLQSDQDEIPPYQPMWIKPKRRIIFSKWWAIAASVALLLGMANWLDLQMVKSGDSVTLSFGPTNHAIANSSPSSQYDDVLAAMHQLRADLDHRIDRLQPVANNASNTATKPPSQAQSVAAMKQLLQRENAGLAEQITQQLQQDQQAYTLEVVRTLMDIWDGQRKEDLQRVNANLENLAQMIQMNSNEFAQFTNETLQNY